MKRCPRCEETLPLSEFGICRARSDGMNLYCKRCIRQKITLGRQAVRAMRAAQKTAGVVQQTQRLTLAFHPRRVARILRKLSPADRVFEAIKLGAHTQKEIVQSTKLPVDEVCDQIANLLLWSKRIRTQVVSNRRRYFVRESVELPERKKMAMSFSSIKVLMPGRRRVA